MSEETPETPEAEGGFAFDPAMLIPLLAAGRGPALGTVEGIGALIDRSRIMAEDFMRVEPITVIEPDTGVEALAYVTREGVFPVEPTIFDAYREAPRFRRGSAAMLSLASFIAHVNRFGDADSAIFAVDDRSAPRLTAVLDYHRADTLSTADEEQGIASGERVHGEYRFGRHRTTFAFPLSDEWKAWTGASGKVMSMIEFAVFLEKNMADIALAGDDFPEDVERFVNTRGGVSMIADYAKLIELSRGLKVHEDAVVEEANVLSSGEGHIRFTSEHRTTKNAAGDTVKVPTLFFIAIPIFKRGIFYRIAAALNYRKTPEGVKFWFDLYRADRSFDHAFNEAVEKVDAETEAQVFFGAPEA